MTNDQIEDVCAYLRSRPEGERPYDGIIGVAECGLRGLLQAYSRDVMLGKWKDSSLQQPGDAYG
jgi:hypothetical protein